MWNEKEVDDRGRGMWVLTNGNCLIHWLVFGHWVRAMFTRTRSEEGTLGGCAQEGFNGHIE